MTDKSIMPFGKYKGRPLEKVPASYLIWLSNNDFRHVGLISYIEENRDSLEDEINDNLINKY